MEQYVTMSLALEPALLLLTAILVLMALMNLRPRKHSEGTAPSMETPTDAGGKRSDAHDNPKGPPHTETNFSMRLKETLGWPLFLALHLWLAPGFGQGLLERRLDLYLMVGALLLLLLTLYSLLRLLGRGASPGTALGWSLAGSFGLLIVMGIFATFFLVFANLFTLFAILLVLPFTPALLYLFEYAPEKRRLEFIPSRLIVLLLFGVLLFLTIRN
jgi:hypothetical protein